MLATDCKRVVLRAELTIEVFTRKIYGLVVENLTLWSVVVIVVTNSVEDREIHISISHIVAERVAFLATFPARTSRCLCHIAQSYHIYGMTALLCVFAHERNDLLLVLLDACVVCSFCIYISQVVVGHCQYRIYALINLCELEVERLLLCLRVYSLVELRCITNALYLVARRD